MAKIPEKTLKVGHWVWILSRNGTSKPDMFRGEIVQIVESDARSTGSIEINTVQHGLRRAPINLVFDSRPKATKVVDDFGIITVWQ